MVCCVYLSGVEWFVVCICGVGVFEWLECVVCI